MAEAAGATAPLAARAPVRIADLPIAPATRAEVTDWVFERLAAGRGGWILTPNLELLQQAAEDPALAGLYARADLRVADGIPLLWLARLQGRPFPERVAGSDLVVLLAERAGREGRSLFLLGGHPGVAREAGARLAHRAPGLRIAGAMAPRVASPPTEEEVAGIRDALREARPDLVYVALGSPKTEQLVDRLRGDLPGMIFLGCGISLSFLTGHVRRAPRWMQRAGLEWLHRMLQEPGRLAGRYLGRNLPFLARLAWRAVSGRARGAAKAG